MVKDNSHYIVSKNLADLFLHSVAFVEDGIASNEIEHLAKEIS